VRRPKPRPVHRPLHRVGERDFAGLALERRAARVAGQRERQDVVAALQGAQHELPGPPGVAEAVEQDQRRPGAAAVAWREGRGQAAHATGVQ
jgi:hypothetical protein